MNIFDIIGPVMVGPSSSHTAGAVRIGYIARRLLGEPVKRADIYLHGSFLATGKGHGTDRALVAGLLEMQTDDERIPDSFQVAQEKGMEFHFEGIELREAHPNSVKMLLTGIHGKKLDIIASSIGGGRIKVCSLNGLEADFSAESPTLIVNNMDKPGIVNEVTAALACENINIATMQLYRDRRGSNAVMILECDGEIPPQAVEKLRKIPGIRNVTYLSMEQKDRKEIDLNME